MKSDTTEQPSSEPTSPGAFRDVWLNPRRKRFWAVILVLAYTLFGFFAVPLLVKNGIRSVVEEDLGRKAQIDRVEFNPYVLSLRVQGFEIDCAAVRAHGG